MLIKHTAFVGHTVGQIESKYVESTQSALSTRKCQKLCRIILDQNIGTKSCHNLFTAYYELNLLAGELRAGEYGVHTMDC